jgi:succinylglutamate desuccinylase
MTDDVIELRGNTEGPTSIILVGVHGDEKCGVQAVEQMLPTLSIEKGIVYVCYGNPRAIQQNIRYTEANLNRMFKPDTMLSDFEKNSYEYSRAQFLKTYLDRVEVLLDIHASYVPYSKPFVICEPNAHDIAKYLPVDLLVSGFDAVEPGGTDYYMNSTGKVGICVECGYLGDEYATEIAIKSITAFLKARGHIQAETPEVFEQSLVEMYDLYYTKTDSFELTKDFKDFDELVPDQLIGVDGENDIRAKKDSVILFARNRSGIGEEAFLLGEYKKKV